MMFPTPVSFIGAAAAVLSFSSMSNMVEMYHAVWKHKSVTETPKPSMVTKRSEWKSPDDALLNLQKMSRRDLIQLYLECDKGDTAAFFGGNSKRKAYDGYLLDNGPVLTHVTNCITNIFFGRGRQWLGKVYFQSEGENRFICKNGERLDRKFDCYIDQSALATRTEKHSVVIINDYSKHCPKWFPASLIWGGMVDELRVILKGKSNVILLGMGYFNWSGGIWNAAPFCLISRDT